MIRGEICAGEPMQAEFATGRYSGTGLSFIPYVLVALTIIGFQSNLVPFFSDSLRAWPAWRPLYYGFWLAALGAAAAALICNRKVAIKTLPVLLLCTGSAALVILHPIDWVAKNYLVAMGLCVSITALALTIGTDRVLRLAAAITAFNALMCLVDIMLDEGFTNTAGRAAGLAQGPNMAAAQLVLGAVVAWRAVPPKWLWPFLLLVGAALVATLSRSCLMVGSMALAAAGVTYFIKHRPRVDAIRWRDVGVGAGLVGWVLVAVVSNDRFLIAVDATYHSLGQAVTAAVQGATSFSVLAAPGATIELPELDQRALSEGEINSAAARSVLLRRALIRYATSPWVGVGPKEAHRLVPHNTYLLLALAFGALGWLVPAGFVVIAVMVAMRTGNWEFPLTVAALFAVSHDVLLFPSSIVLLALGLSQLSQHGSVCTTPHSVPFA
ncbi:O-antigen ligase family protein [Mesorhizobium sp. BAC0120]|uniref:O-antigen ligase family protein n=1 Tax=Mesorhizobium sp. BAC0120 TaxID=3090670 RepID=UPI00298CC304|nr:O-antigen ligase family protein [Mesorhizobium sp. BAC0120]MDW6020962.1 O-antigen ligase family protein [Mesorhizobium sp. BAC0120]